jgi:hypothetical protein
MIPRNASRHFILAFCLGFIALGSAIPAHTENALAAPGLNQGTTKGYCASESSGPVVYFSSIFDARTNPHWTISAEPLNFAFKNYLIEEYDFKSSSNYPINCGIFETLSQAEASKRQLVTDAQRGNKRVVEVNWKPGSGVEVLQSPDPNFMPAAPPTPTHTFCAVGHESTMYFSAVFDTVGALNNQAWSDAFNDFLRKTYSAEGLATCTIMNTVREAERNLKGRVAGVRASSHKAVETGWKYDPTVKVTRAAPKPTPKADDDPEPQQKRPTAPAPPADIRTFAQKEGSAALTQCQNDKIMSGAFDCYRVQRAVYNYRIEHAADVRPEPLVNLLDKLDCSQCIIDYLVKMWAKSAAQSRGLQASPAECVAQRFVTNVQAEPYPGHAKKLFEAAITACHK